MEAWHFFATCSSQLSTKENAEFQSFRGRTVADFSVSRSMLHRKDGILQGLPGLLSGVIEPINIFSRNQKEHKNKDEGEREACTLQQL